MATSKGEPNSPASSIAGIFDFMRVDKKRDKMERKVLDSQERAFWDVHRPVPGCVNTTEMDIKKLSRINRTCKKKLKQASLSPCTSDQDLQNNEESLQRTDSSHHEHLHFACCTPILFLSRKVDMLKARLEKRQYKTSKVAELLISYCQQYRDYDSFFTPPEGSNPWVSDDTSLWESAKTMNLKDVPVWRVKKWGFSFEDLLKDPLGRDQLSKFLAKEFSEENIRFYVACQELKALPISQVPAKAQEIYDEFLSDASHCPINVDSKTQEITKQKMLSIDRYTFDAAQDHIFLLMRNDSYTRFLKSEQYKELLNPKKKEKKNKKSPFGQQNLPTFFRPQNTQQSAATKQIPTAPNEFPHRMTSGLSQ